ncbi:MAG: hypothetical protein RID53_34450 [Coleofasciculus sp. B1-GNL1-01]
MAYSIGAGSTDNAPTQTINLTKSAPSFTDFEISPEKSDGTKVPTTNPG